MNTFDVAKYWNLELKDTVLRMAKSGVFVLNPNEKLHKTQLTLIGINAPVETESEINSSELEGNVDNDYLEECVINNVILIDCCSLLVSGSEKLLSQLIPYLIKYKRKLIIPVIVMSEIEKVGKKDQSLSDTISGVKFMLTDMVKRNLIMFVKSEEDSYFADPVFLSHFHQLRLKTNILLITQDMDLSYDVLSINNTRSVKSKYRIAVCKVTDKGNLVERCLTPDGNLIELKPAVMKVPEDKKQTSSDYFDQNELFKSVLSKLVKSEQESVKSEEITMTTNEVFDTIKRQLTQDKKDS